MAFSKKAFANVVHPNWGTQNWQRFREEHRSELVGMPSRTASGSPSSNLVAQASEILQDQFSPEKYLLTHATIVASVDTSDVPGIRLGAVSEMGRSINRKWANYSIKPGTDIYINNNHDAWDRPVLLNSYRTFVGAHNFVEHVQIEEQSKGRVIDAVARDIGDSIYVDILLATNRVHESLVRDIEADRMGTLSMGCSVTETQCTKCGNVAADETEMCEHIKYAKGNYEYDGNGNKFRIAELCGHHTLDPNAGVTFIEASWVAIPAFQGAVKRNIIQPESINIDTRSKMRQVLESPPPQWAARNEGQPKAARMAPAVAPSFIVAQEEDPMAPPPEGGDEGGDPGAPGGGMPDPMAPGGDPGGGMPGAPGAEPEKDPLEELQGDIEKYVLDKIRTKLKDKMQGEDREDAASPGQLETSTNENLNHQGSMVLAAGLDTLLRIAQSDIELLDGLARLNESHSIKFSREVYRTACRVGSTDKHPSLEMYLRRCAEVLTRQPTVGEAKTLVRLGRILSLRKKTRF